MICVRYVAEVVICRLNSGYEGNETFNIGITKTKAKNHFKLYIAELGGGDDDIKLLHRTLQKLTKSNYTIETKN